MRFAGSKNRRIAICFGMIICILFCWYSMEQLVDRTPLDWSGSGSCTISMDKMERVLSESLVSENATQSLKVNAQSDEKSQNLASRCLMILWILSRVMGVSAGIDREQRREQSKIRFSAQIILGYMQRSDGKKEPLLLS